MTQATAEQAKRIGDALQGVRSAVGAHVMGYEDAVTDLLLGLLADGHVLLEGVPGVAKTTLAKSFATAVGLTFHRIQFTQDLLPADITGHFFYNQRTHDFEIRRGAVFSHVLLADEINRAPPKTQSALLEAMEERQVTIEGQTLPLPRPFIVVATMNPIDVEGVYRLPEAQLDRFMIRTRMGYLEPEMERRMLLRKLHTSTSVTHGDGETWIEEARRAVRMVLISEEVVGYLHEVALATRRHPSITLGASPRSMEQLLNCARAHALLEGRSYAIPDDVKAVIPRGLNHRLILDVDAEIEGMSASAILRDLLASVPVPKGGDGRGPSAG